MGLVDRSEDGSRESSNKMASRFGDHLFGQSQGVEIVIQPFSFYEREVVALLDDASVVEHEDSVGSLNGALSAFRCSDCTHGL